MTLDPRRTKAAFTINDTDQCLKQNRFVFTNTSTITTNPKNYSWTFGDGNTSTNTSDVHQYGNAGTYTVVATVLGFVLIALAVRLVRERSTLNARRLFLYSIIYLPILWGALVVEHLWP